MLLVTKLSEYAKTVEAAQTLGITPKLGQS
jgi:hypothetical protein